MSLSPVITCSDLPTENGGEWKCDPPHYPGQAFHVDTACVFICDGQAVGVTYCNQFGSWVPDDPDYFTCGVGSPPTAQPSSYQNFYYSGLSGDNYSYYNNNNTVNNRTNYRNNLDNNYNNTDYNRANYHSNLYNNDYNKKANYYNDLDNNDNTDYNRANYHQHHNPQSYHNYHKINDNLQL